MDWRSHRVRRKCRSTVAAEAMAMDAGVDAASQIRVMLAEALLNDFSTTRSGSLPPDFIPIQVVTDCRSLYDLLTKEGTPSTTMEKRLAIDIAAICEIADEYDQEDPKETFKWCPTDYQLADYLTKVKGNGPEKLREVLDKGIIRVPQQKQSVELLTKTKIGECNCVFHLRSYNSTEPRSI